MRSAIIMAGGQSRRMRQSLGHEHKALVKVLGVPMLERNVLALLSHGFREIFLAVNEKERSLLAFAKGRAAQLMRACDCELKLIVETQPLGTIGAAAKVQTASDDLVVVNVDNLTTLDLAALLKHHRSRKAAMTIATHTEPFKVPFGQVSVKRGWITRYQEKPILPVLLSSGTYVLNKSARLIIPLERAVGAPEVVNMLLDRGHSVAAFEHSSAWIDVNDSASLQRAEELIMANFKGFEMWRQSPHRQVAVLCVVNDAVVAVKKKAGVPTVAGLPIIELSKGEPDEAIAQCSHTGLIRAKSARVLACLDDIDARTGKRTRWHVILAEPTRSFRSRRNNGSFQWAQIKDLSTVLSGSHVNYRALSYLNQFAAHSDSVSH